MFGIDDALAWAPLVFGGLNKLGQGLGLWQSPETANAKAYSDWMEKNYPDFNYNYGGLDQSKYQDILQPMAQRQAQERTSMGNNLALGGLGRSGIGAEIAANQQRGQDTQYNNMLSGLRRQDEATDFQRALQKYEAQARKAEAIGRSRFGG